MLIFVMLENSNIGLKMKERFRMDWTGHDADMQGIEPDAGHLMRGWRLARWP